MGDHAALAFFLPVSRNSRLITLASFFLKIFLQLPCSTQNSRAARFLQNPLLILSGENETINAGLFSQWKNSIEIGCICSLRYNDMLRVMLKLSALFLFLTAIYDY